MIRHQAVGKNITIGKNIFSCKRKKAEVIIFFIENFLPSVSLVINVISMIAQKVHQLNLLFFGLTA